ncbi:MAG: hypothetical protein M3Q07_22330, partial [Pseudobdellovibrionaceae bacterium]|nr:hypothetical protein [Pseudobdellovibrionaceae bacterium]
IPSINGRPCPPRPDNHPDAGFRLEKTGPESLLLRIDACKAAALPDEIKAKIDNEFRKIETLGLQQDADEESDRLLTEYTHNYLGYLEEQRLLNMELATLDFMYWMLDNVQSSAIGGGLTYAGVKFGEVGTSARVQAGYAALATFLIEIGGKYSKSQIEKRKREIGMIYSDLRDMAMYEAARMDDIKFGVNPPEEPREKLCVWQRMCRTVNIIVTQGGRQSGGPSHICVNFNPTCR